MLKNLTNLSFCLCIGLVFYQCIDQEVYGKVQSIGIEKLDVINNKVTLSANNISLKDVLQALCDEANIQLALKGQFQNKVNITVYNQPADQFFRSLLVNSDFVLIFSKDNQSIKKILVYESSGNRQTFILSIAEPVTKEILEELEWIHYLSTRPEDEAISALSDILSTKGSHLKSKQYAIEQLSSFSHNKAIVNVISEGLSDDRSKIREQVINALGQLKYQTAHQILGQVIFGEELPSLRLQAVKQLANIHTPASKAFLKSATKDKNPAVQSEAQFILESYLY